MLDPVGPLEPAVYWRRRAVALLAIALSVVLIFWVVSRLASAAAGDDTGAAAETSTSESTGASADPSSQADQSASSGDSSGAAGNNGNDAASSDGDSVADPESAASPSADASTVPPTSASTPAPPPAPTACAPEAIQVFVWTPQLSFAKGTKPTIVLSVVNAGALPCYRDLNAATQELTIWTPQGVRLWSSNDCYPEASNDERLLEVGQKVDFEIVWSGKVSEPTCTQPRPLLGPGQYHLAAAQDGIVSAPIAFTIT